MDIDDKELTPEEVKISDVLEGASRRLTEIDYWINNPPDRTGPKLTPEGPDLNEWTPERAEHFKKTLEYRKDLIKAQTKESSVRLLEKSSLEVQLRAYRKIDEWAEPAGNKEKNLIDRRATQKDISDSQDTTMLLLADEKKRVEQKNLVENVEPKNPVAENLSSPSAASTYKLTLSYNRMNDRPDNGPDKTDKFPETDMDKD